MKELDIRIRNGGDDAIAAACELAGLAKARRGYEDTMQAKEDITDVVTVLRGVGFSSVSPEAGDSASLLHRVVMAAADEIEHLRNERRWIPVGERLPDEYDVVMVGWAGRRDIGKGYLLNGKWHDPLVCKPDVNPPTHWMPLPEPPQVK
jgi:hypothetical protein